MALSVTLLAHPYGLLIYYYFFHLYIYLPALQKSDGGAIHKASNYSFQRSRNSVARLKFYTSNFLVFEIGLKFRSACQDREQEKVL